MKKILLFLCILFITPVVFAQDFNVSTSDVSSPIGGGRTGTYTGTEIYNTGTSTYYYIGTRYNGRLSRIIFNLVAGGYADPDGFEKGHTYTLTMNMATDDWRNKFGSVSVKCEGSSGTELSNGKVTYVSYKKIKFSFTAPTNRYCQFVYVDLKSPNVSSTAFTGVNNWNLSSLVISDPSYCSGSSCGGSSSTPVPTPTSAPSGATNQDIINNQNSNTNSIINNQNSNTNSIVNNQNSNTNDIIENSNQNTQDLKDAINNDLASCYYSSYNYNLFAPVISGDIEVNGMTEIPNNNYVHSENYIKVKPNTTYTLSYSSGSYAWSVIEYATTSDMLNYGSQKTSTGSFTTGLLTHYIKFSIRHNPSSATIPTDIYNSEFQLTEGGSKTYRQSQGSVVCASKIDDTTNAINEVNESINNDSIDDKTGFFSGFTDNDHGLTSILTIPLSTIQQLTNTSCVALSLPIPFTNSSVSLPCMTEVYQNFIPSIFNIWQVVSFGLISYWICLDIYKMVKGFKDPNEDKVEVLDL